MVVRVATVAFEGIEAKPVDVQVQISGGNVGFAIVGLADKAVAESRERVRAALNASGLALPAKKITVNLAPADVPKEGSHYDLPIALAVMAAIGAIPSDALANFTVLGELALDGAITPVAGALPAAVAANARGHGLICPFACGPEAAWASSDIEILAPRSLIQLANHVRGTQVMARPKPAMRAKGAGDAGPARHQGAGERQARARDRRRRRPQSADERAAGLGQVDAGRAPALDPAAALAARIARSLDDPFGRRRAGRWRAHRSPAVPRAASFGLDARAGRRGNERAPGRGVARPSRRAVPRRIARVQRARARFACASRWRRAKSPSRACIIASSIPRASSWSRP